MRSRIVIALAPYIGKTLTPEAAEAILRQFPDDAPKAIDLAAIEPARCGRLTFQAESIVGITSELNALHRANLAEDPAYGVEIGSELDFCELMLEERYGTLIQFTARDGDALVGQMRVLLRRETHSGRRFAREESVYLRPEYRSGRNAWRFMWFPHRTLRALGYATYKAKVRRGNVGVRGLLKRAHFELVSYEYILNDTEVSHGR
jgi:hypothetical protein